ncbi:MAG: hypothetical protein ACTSR8_01100 [Promethearchaeota archaeon]
MVEQENPDELNIRSTEEIQDPDEVEKQFSIEELRESISWGTRKIKIHFNQEDIIFFIVNLSEKKKYGTKSSEKIDDNNNICSKASLSLRDNYVFLASTTFKGQGKMTKKEVEKGMNEKTISKTLHSGIKRGSIYIDEDGNFVHKKFIDFYDNDGKKLEKIPSSLYLKNSQNEIKLEKLIDINEALDHDVKSRYILFPEQEDADENFRNLLYEFEDSDIPKYFSFKFNYYPSYEPMDAFLQLIEENENEYILMNVGNKNETRFFGMDTSMGNVIDIDDEFEFDLSL